MLKSLLRYDFRAVLKYWWIAVVSVLAFSVIGGGCIAVLDSDKTLPTVVTVLAVIGLILSILGFFAFYLLTVILVFVRFYKNFFTDEGYLTFTLPVKRTQLLNSKLIMSTSVLCGSGLLMYAGILIMLAIGLGRHLSNPEFWEGFPEFSKALLQELDAYVVIYALELLALCVLAFAFFSLLVFCCITFASIITRKAKVLAAIGIYYAANSVLSFVTQLLYLFALPNLSIWLTNMPESQIKATFALLMLVLVLFAAVFCMLLYCLEYWMLDRKLNLN